MEKQITISGQTLPVREYKGQRVITYQDIAIVHNIPVGNLQENFRRNRRYFIEGKDYFHLEGKKDTQKFCVSSKMTVRLNLFTETGYLMLVKSLTDDLSWRVQRELVESYFRVKQFASQIDPQLLPELIFLYLERNSNRSEIWFKKLLHYRWLQLTQIETAKLLDSSRSSVQKYENVLKKVGFRLPNLRGHRTGRYYLCHKEADQLYLEV